MLTTKELSSLEDQLKQEQLMVKKCKLYSQGCADPQLKQKWEQIAARHQDHYTRLLNQIK